MLGQRVDCYERLQPLRALSVLLKLCRMQPSPLAHQTQCTWRKRAAQYTQRAELDQRQILPVLGMEMRRWMIRAIHPDHDPVERRHPRRLPPLRRPRQAWTTLQPFVAVCEGTEPSPRRPAQPSARILSGKQRRSRVAAAVIRAGGRNASRLSNKATTARVGLLASRGTTHVGSAAWRARTATTAAAAANTEIVVRATGSDVRSARKPMSGGPARKPQ
jgi:hypothetical protein